MDETAGGTVGTGADVLDPGRPRRRVVLGVSADVSLGLLQGYPAHLAERGWDVHVVSSPGPRLRELEGQAGVTVHPLAMVRDPSPLQDLRSLVRWVRLLHALRPDTVYVGTPKAGLLGTVAAVLTRVPHRVYILRGLRFETARGAARPLLMALEHLAAAGAHVVFAVSPSLRDRSLASGIGSADKVRVLGRGSSNGVDTSHFDRQRFSEPQRCRLAADLGLEPGLPVVGFVGRLAADKGLHDLATAHRLLEAQGVPHQLLVVGPVEDGGAALRAFGAEQDGLVRTGAVADAAPYYALMDVLVLPTRREGFPNVVLEASACAVPVVTTEATGAVDSVLDGHTGYVVPVGDPAALARAAATVLADPAAGRRLGEQGREFVAAHFERTRFWTHVDELLERGTADQPKRPRRPAGALSRVLSRRAVRPTATPSLRVRLRARLVRLAGRLDPQLVRRPVEVWLSVRGRQPCQVRYDDGMWVRRYRDATLVDTRLGGPTPQQQDAKVSDVYLYGYLPQPGDTVVDVGAGVGSEARLLSHLVGPSGRVYCVEADPRAARCLRRTVAENALGNVVVVEAALSSRRGTVRLELDPESYVSNRLAHDGRSGIDVRAVTFADLMQEVGPGPVALVKMNIEGAEGEVLVPPPPELARVERLAVSCHDFRANQPGCAWQATSAGVTAALRSSGYDLQSRPDDPRPWVRWYLYASRP